MLLKIMQFSSPDQHKLVFSFRGKNILRFCSACSFFFSPKSFTHFFIPHFNSAQESRAQYSKKSVQDGGRQAPHFLSWLGGLASPFWLSGGLSHEPIARAILTTSWAHCKTFPSFPGPGYNFVLEWGVSR